MSYYISDDDYRARPLGYRETDRYNVEAEPLNYRVRGSRRRRTSQLAAHDEYEVAGQHRGPRHRPQHRNVNTYRRYQPPGAQRPVEPRPVNLERINLETVRPRHFEKRVVPPSYAARYETSPDPLVDVNISSEQAPGTKDEQGAYYFAPRKAGRDSPSARSRSRSYSPVRRRSRSRSSSRSRDTVRVVYPASYEVMDLENYDEFSFDCKKSEQFDTSDSLSFDASSLDPDTSPADADRVIEDSRVKLVYYSRYTGDAETGGRHTAQLTEIHKGRGELFKWLHIQQQVMNFDEFWSEVSRRIHLSDTERRSMNRLRADVTKHCVKSRYNPKGVNVGYMEPRFVQTPLDTPKKKFDSVRDDASVGMVRWFCMPFFVLKQYSGLAEGSTLSVFPSQTLLQAQYSRTTQQRDMGQAVCELGIANKGECFHIDQMWCLVVGDSILVTCGNMPRSKLEGQAIKIISEPTRALPVPSAQGRILVKYGNSLTWSFSLEECPTWFQFIGHFTAFWPMALEFKKEDAVLTAADWPKLLRFLGTTRRKNVLLTLTTDTRDVPSRAFPSQEEKEAANGMPLHTLTLIVQSSENVKKPTATENELTVQLAAADKFLTEQTAYSTQTAYIACPDEPRTAILERLRREGAEVEEQKSDFRKKAYEDGIELFNIADTLFELFLPLTCGGPTTGKFWGAVSDLACATRIMPTESDDGPRRARRELQLNQEELLRLLRRLFPKIRAFQFIMSHMPEEDRQTAEAPRQFVTAWLHVVSGLVLCRVQAFSWKSHFSIAVDSLLSEGMDRMIQAIQTNDLLGNVVLQPFEIASLVVLKLMQDRTSQADDINETYSQYLASLDNDIATKPSDRSYQHRIDLVRRELSAVRRTVTRQRQIFASMRQTLYPHPMIDFFRGGEDEIYTPRERYLRPSKGLRNTEYQEYYVDNRHDDDRGSLDYALKVSPTDKNGFRGLLLTENSRLLDQRDFEFKRYVEYVDDLERTIAFKMDWTKDRQENAVYAFTIVTIIFLPLSSIAGIFGMNTSDVRDMEAGQWLYWAVALPVTVMVIVIGLWWMNELGNVVRWLTGQQPSANVSAGTGYGVVTAEPSEDQYYTDTEEARPRRLLKTYTMASPYSLNDGRRPEMRKRRM